MEFWGKTDVGETHVRYFAMTSIALKRLQIVKTQNNKADRNNIRQSQRLSIY